MRPSDLVRHLCASLSYCELESFGRGLGRDEVGGERVLLFNCQIERQVIMCLSVGIKRKVCLPTNKSYHMIIWIDKERLVTVPKAQEDDIASACFSIY